MAATAAAKLEAGQRLGQHLHALRTQQGVTVHQIHQATKISEGILEAFEATVLVDEPGYNKVYIRSIARSYARLLQVDEQTVLAALEEAFGGSYVDALAVAYLGAKPTRSVTKPAKPVAGSLSPKPEPKAKPAREAVASPPPHVRTQKSKPSPPSSMQPTRLGKVRDEKAEHSSSSDESFKWAGIALGVVVFVCIIAGVVWLVKGGTSPESPEVTTVVEPDTVPTLPVPPPPEPLVLGDTIAVSVIAVRDKLERIRVTLDDDVRRPYWREQGDTLVFNITNQIILESNLPRIDVQVEGYEVPFDASIPVLTLTRSLLQAHIDTVSVQ